MNIKKLIKKYITLQKFLKEDYKNLLEKNYTFYILELSQDARKWQSNICLSQNEVKALKAFYVNNTNKRKPYLLELEIPRKAKIIKLSLEDILKDEILTKKLTRRIELIPKYNEKILVSLTKKSDIKIFWNFEKNLEVRYLYYKEDKFIYNFYENKKLPFFINEPYLEVINSKGKYGLIHKDGIYQNGQLKLIYKCKYHHILTKGVLAQIQKEKTKSTQNYKNYLCTIIDLETNDIYSNKALCNTLNQDNFIEVTKKKKFKYIKIDKKREKPIIKSKEYDYIVNLSILNEKPVFSKKEKLWGYINKNGEEIIKPKFKNYGIFNSGYALINEDEKYFVIDTQGKIQIAKKEFIKHFRNDVFFVKENKKYAIYKKNKKIIDFIDINKELEKIKNDQNFDEKELLKYLRRIHRKNTYQFSQEKNPIFLFLELELIKEKSKLIKNKYKLSLKEYINQFKKFENQIDLNISELINHKVKVKNCEILKKYKDIIIESTKGTIGLKYPINKNMFDMNKELPVQFVKTNNEILTLGIKFKYLELIR